MKATANGAKKTIFGHSVTAWAVGDKDSTWYFRGCWSRGDFKKTEFESTQAVFDYFENCQLKNIRP